MLPAEPKRSYYVYAYLRSNDNSPYYVGKGTGRRMLSPMGKAAKPPKERKRIVLLRQSLTEGEAFYWEIFYIKHYGRKDLGTGMLRNRSNGGEGCSGSIRAKEVIEKQAAKVRGIPKTEEHKAKLRGKRGPQPKIAEAAEKRWKERMQETKPRVVKMLLEGKTAREIYAELRVSPNKISE